MRGNLASILRSWGFNRAVAYASLTSITPVLMSPITVVLIVTRFSAEIQGYYYTFAGLSALQSLAELGLGQAVIQFASHEWAKLNLDAEGRIVGDAEALSRLLSLGRLAFKWFGAMSLFFTIFLGFVGIIQFSSPHAYEVHWVGPWVMFCISIAINLLLMPVFYILQGCNQVTPFWYYRWIQRIVSGLSLWIAMALGAALWTLPISAFAGLVWTIYFLVRKYRKFIKMFFNPVYSHSVINWRKEVWPMQWRVAISWTSSYLPTQLFAPILFSFSGAVVAGQMGMTNSLGSILLAISSSWILTKAPHYGVLIAQKRYIELDSEYRKSFLSSFITALIGALGIWGIVFVLDSTRQNIGTRILPLLPLGLFLIGILFNTLTTSLAVYLRAHKKEPLAGVYLVAGLLIIGSALSMGRRFGTTGVNSGYLLVMALVQFPGVLFIFSRCRRIWHAKEGWANVIR